MSMMNSFLGSLLSLTLLTQTPPPASEEPAPAPAVRGRIQGGWEYVWASYGIAAAAMSLYGLSLWRRTQAAKQERKETP